MLPYLRESPRRSRSPARRRPRDASRASRRRASRSARALRCATTRGRVHRHRYRSREHRGVRGARPRRRRGHVVTTAVEHSSVLDAIARTTDDVTVIGVDRRGRFDARAVADAVRPDTALVSVQLANHEVGTLQPAAEIVGARRTAGSDAVVHVDACAAAGHVPVDFGVLGADLCSVTGHTFGGPKGASALFVRRGLRFPPFVVGGAQERARRAGIENVPAIVGFGAACDAIAGRRARGRGARDARARAHAWPTSRYAGSTASSASAIRSTASPTSCASASTGSRPSRSCSRSTSVASPCTPDRRARASRSSRHRCSRRWASTPTARCGPASAGRRPTPTSTRSSTPCPSSSDCCGDLRN